MKITGTKVQVDERGELRIGFEHGRQTTFQEGMDPAQANGLILQLDQAATEAHRARVLARLGLAD